MSTGEQIIRGDYILIKESDVLDVAKFEKYSREKGIVLNSFIVGGGQISIPIGEWNVGVKVKKYDWKGIIKKKVLNNKFNTSLGN